MCLYLNGSSVPLPIKNFLMLNTNFLAENSWCSHYKIGNFSIAEGRFLSSNTRLAPMHHFIKWKLFQQRVIGLTSSGPQLTNFTMTHDMAE